MLVLGLNVIYMHQAPYYIALGPSFDRRNAIAVPDLHLREHLGMLNQFISSEALFCTVYLGFRKSRLFVYLKVFLFLDKCFQDQFDLDLSQILIISPSHGRGSAPGALLCLLLARVHDQTPRKSSIGKKTFL